MLLELNVRKRIDDYGIDKLNHKIESENLTYRQVADLFGYDSNQLWGMEITEYVNDRIEKCQTPPSVNPV